MMNLTLLTVFIVALICCSTMFESTVAIDDTVVFNIRPTKADNLDRSEIQATRVSVQDIAVSTDDDRNTTDGEMCNLSFIDLYIIIIYIYQCI